MDRSEIVKNAVEYIRTLFEGNADGHDVNHSLRVYKNAVKIACAYPEADLTVVELSAILHDADDHKLFKTENNENARKFLMENGVDPSVIERICTVINAVSFSKNRGRKPETIEGCIVQDADRLDAMGAIGIARTFAYGGKHGRSIEESKEHFYEKLLLLKDEMNLEEAKKISERRHILLEKYVEELEDKLKID